MSFPNVPFNKVKTAAVDAIHNWGVDATIQLRDQSTFQLKATRAVPSLKSAVQGMTDGLQQNELKCMVLYEDWHAGAGADREPEKGDTIMFAGRLHAITGAYNVKAEDVNFGYDIRMKG